MGNWKKKLGIGCGGFLLILAAGLAWLWFAKPWVPQVENTQPRGNGLRVEQDGIIANFYPGPLGQRSPGILLLGGSEGGLGSAIEGWGRALNEQGYAVLVLSYYRLKGQPERFELIPLETFYKGLDWLKRRSDVDGKRIAIIGASKGAEAALLVASRRPEVRTVVAAMPSHIVWNGFDWAMSPVTTSSWSEAGKPVPFLPITETSWKGDVYSVALKDAAHHPDAMIPVERIEGPILLICGEADTLWPSCPMARQVQARRASSGKSPDVLLAYQNAGHLVFGLPISPGNPSRQSLDMLGGTADGNAGARADSWPKMLNFLRTNLGDK